MPAAALVIAAESLIAALRERVSVDGDIITFAATEPIQALQVIIQERPNLVVLERLFAATPRGAALINRIKSDPQLAHTEVRVMSHTGDYTRQGVKPPAGAPEVGGGVATGRLHRAGGQADGGGARVCARARRQHRHRDAGAVQRR